MAEYTLSYTTDEINEKLGMVPPTVSTTDNDKILQVVNGKYAVVAITDSSIATYINNYIDNYIAEALGGEY